MVRTQISLLGILFVAIFIQTFLVPGLWGSLRIDFLIGMIIGVIIHLTFSEGLLFVMVSSLVLQAFSGARPGLIPLLYLFGYLVMDILKNVIYMENVFTQAILAVVFNTLMVAAYAVSVNMTLGVIEIGHLLAGSLITGIVSPFVISMVGYLKKTYDA
jgi:hypothetical protein